MSNKILSLGKIFGFIALVVFMFMFILPFAPIFIAATLGGGILGNVIGKVGPVVGGMWKGINYIRSYVIPANPQSVDQTTQRTRFSVIQEYVRQVLSTLVHPYWDQYQVGQSGYNAITSDWMLNADSNNFLVAACKAAKGTLSPQAIDISTYVTGTGLVEIAWTEALSGNQLTTDKPHALIFDKGTGLLHFSNGANTRAEETMLMTIPTGLTVANLLTFLFFSQGVGSTMIVSDSTSYVTEAG